MAILKTAPAGARVLDLGGARAARAEARAAAGESNPVIKLSAGYIELNSEVGLEVAILLQGENIKGGLAGLLADPADVDLLIADGVSAEDLELLMKFVTGVSLGEFSASPTP